ncbi:kinase-like domain-containing protein [Melampsora americana]|nr:kinase-like domain-containing protein [Melampsora americana]
MPINSNSTTSTISSSSSASSSTSSVLQHIQSHRDVPVEQLFTKLDIVGKGAYGAVYKGIHNATGTILALKVINLDTAEDDIIEIQREVALLSQLRDSDRHNCIGYHGCYFYKTELWIAMDFASGGSIRTLLKPGKIEEKFTQLIIRETLIGLNYLHRQDIIHRDIKSANILLTNSHRVLLCDFGIAAPLQSTNHKRSTFIGTPYWMAPEVIADGRLYDTKADIWSLGITLYEMLNGNPPYSDLTPAKVILKIPRSQPAKLEGNQFSNGVKEFLAACLIDEPNDRPTADELMKHKWIKSISKAPLTPLKDLTNRYSRWINSGGVRQSLAGASPHDNFNRPESMNVDKSDWDFMDDADPDPDDSNDSPDGLNHHSENDQWNTSKDSAITVRPNNTYVQPSRQNRPHRLLKLFEEESNNFTPPMGMFGGYQGPFPHSPNLSVPSPNQTPMIGLGFHIPGMPGANHLMSPGDVMMDVSPPMISIPSEEELDVFLEPPNPNPNTNPNRPFSPAGLNRSTTPTPNNYQRMPMINTSAPSVNRNKPLATSSPLLTPTMGSLPFSARATPEFAESPDTSYALSPMPDKSSDPTFSNGAVSISPSLPVVSRKDSLGTSSRNRANTAPATQDGTPANSANNTPVMPSTRSNFSAAGGGGASGGGGGKQFGGNGFSFGGPSSTSSANNTPMPATNGNNSLQHAPSPYLNNILSPERGFKSSQQNNHSNQLNNSGYHHLVPPLPLPNRLRSGTETSTNQNSITIPSSSSSSSQPPPVPHTPQLNKPQSTSNNQIGQSSITSGTTKSVGKWPNGVIKPSKELNYHALIGVKEVKSELENTLGELSEWLESCEIGLGMLIEAMK